MSDRFRALLGSRRGAERPDERLLVVVSCPPLERELGRGPLELRAYESVSQAHLLAAAIEHFDYRRQPCSLRMAASASDTIGLPERSGFAFRDPGSERVELVLLPGLGGDGFEWWHGEGYTDHPELVVWLERWAAERVPSVRVVEPVYGAGGPVLRAEGDGPAEEYQLSAAEWAWVDSAWPLWMRVNGLLAPPAEGASSSTACS